MLRALTIAASLLSVGGGPVAPATAALKPSFTRGCSDKLYHAGTRRPANGPRRLVEESPADVYLSVYRRDTKGCADPVIVRQGVGARAADKKNPRR